MFNFIKKVLGDSNDREVSRLSDTVKKINALEPKYQAMTDAQLGGLIGEFRARYGKGETLDDLLPEAYAAMREGAVRTLGQRAFDVQLLGAIALHQGRIAEMRTGEGKTLTATFPAYLNAIPGEGVHIVTMNEYLARFQSEWMGKVYRFMGLTVGLIEHEMSAEQRQAAYAADVTYATNNELGFDYLRDNMATRRERLVQRPLNFAIVDEVDSILIDEARTPLIISGQGEKSTEMYARVDRFIPRLTEAKEKDEKDEPIPESGDYIRDEKQKSASLTESGVRKAEAYFGVDNLTDPGNTELYHHILQALKANVMMKRDVDYVVKDGQVIIVDEFTGRLMVGRRYSDGLHQAIEAKEHVKVERESKTLATITFQNYFRMYKKLSGMTGTAKTEEEEFRGIYKLDVVTIPTNRPMIRKDLNDSVYLTQKGKFNAVVEEVVSRHATGQPILVGTVSVEKSELLSRMLEQRGVRHVVLNAKFHEKEAEIVAQAGRKGAVTIATNMAGRGTDILLGGNAEFMARKSMRAQEYDEELIEEAIGFNENVSDEVKAARKVFRELLQKYEVETKAGHDEVIKLGGLHIIGTERHESRRIDNQLRGRAGRQGDPGSSQFFIAMDDDLMRLFGSDRIQPIISRLGVKEDEAIEAKVLTGQIESAQKRVEGRNYGIRKSVLQFDDVMNQQREVIYSQRREVLMGSDMREHVKNMRHALVEDAVTQFCAGDNEGDWDMKGLAQYLEHICLKPDTVERVFNQAKGPDRKSFVAMLEQEAEAFYAEREQTIEEMGISMREFERMCVLTAVDRRWMDHIDAMDQLREGIGLRAYGQRDPIVEYKHEGYAMFEEMSRLIQEDTLRRLCYAVLVKQPPQPPKEEEQKLVASHGGQVEGAAPKTVRAGMKVGRNDPCPCGSGKKYKECCGKGK